MEPEVITQVVAHSSAVHDSGLGLQSLFNIFIAFAAFVMGIAMNRLFSKLDSLTAQDKDMAEEIKDLRVSLPTYYVMKEDLQRLSDALFTKLDSIEGKLDKKQDKS